ncbi:MAG: flagellar protein FliS [Phycisphaerales bacterium]|nr:flagellar protein FliS [Phycisphaerales bacterium]
MSTDTATAYLRTQVTTASPEQLRLMLLDGAIRFARQGREGLVSKNHESVYEGFQRSRNIVLELTNTKPDIDPTLRSRINGLYTFIYMQLVDASFERDLGKADKAIELLEYERETWVLAMQRAAELRRGAAPESPTNPPAVDTARRPTLSIQG